MNTNLLADTPKPLYQKVKDYIMSQIVSGAWPPDTRIPSENNLVKKLNISRMTVNRAFRELAVEGKLIRLQGVGTYVAPPKPLSALFEIRSIAQEIKEWGGKHSSKVHLLTEEKASADLANLMHLPVSARVFHSIIVHKDRGSPVLLGDRYVNPASAPDYLRQDFTLITPSDYLLQVVPLTDIEHIIEASLPNKMMQRLLEIGADEPCLILHRQTWGGNQVVTHSRFIYPGSRYRIGGRFRPLAFSDKSMS